jgi:choline dehydrogenase-like flavoprotein
MFIDARTLPDHTNLDADLAIIGGGPAGITLARTFVRSGISVVVAEAGGLERDNEVQTLYQGENAGIEYPLEGARLRFLGGSSNHWGGYCRVFDPIDFESREWVPNSGWPFGIEELQPYYPMASSIVEVAPGRYEDPDYWRERTGQEIPDLQTQRMRLQFVHFSATKFGIRYGPELKLADNIRVLLNANVVEIKASGNAAQAQRLVVRTLNGLNHTIKAKYYVVATGGLENARMLLLSNSVAPAGLGNAHDLVGRFFMEHPHVSGFGDIVAADLKRIPRILRERISVDKYAVQAAFNPTESFLRKQRLLNATFMIGMAGEYQSDDGKAQSAKSWKRAAHQDMLKAAHRFLTDGQGPVKPDNPDYLGAWLGMGCACEQIPNPDSRVTLSEQRDVLGLPKIRLDWRLTEQDRRSLVEHMHSLALEFGALGMGRMMLHIGDDGLWPKAVGGGSHHMGTTRMSNNPKQGVVDPNCRVHGMDNLYVIGSSVFPTGGSANPTLTIVALTLRLADHLKERFNE